MSKAKRQEYPFMACCTLCGEQILSDTPVIQLQEGTVDDDSLAFTADEYPLLYHEACFNKWFKEPIGLESTEDTIIPEPQE